MLIIVEELSIATCASLARHVIMAEVLDVAPAWIAQLTRGVLAREGCLAQGHLILVKLSIAPTRTARMGSNAHGNRAAVLDFVAERLLPVALYVELFIPPAGDTRNLRSGNGHPLIVVHLLEKLHVTAGGRARVHRLAHRVEAREIALKDGGLWCEGAHHGRGNDLGRLVLLEHLGVAAGTANACDAGDKGLGDGCLLILEKLRIAARGTAHVCERYSV
mmetsp:Transcript_23439/g.46850  ORF Transcript_23439/g.46850 Transcript_23439/m.46850 type:complete len:219 (-) Transcript_23439:48-704(-)